MAADPGQGEPASGTRPQGGCRRQASEGRSGGPAHITVIAFSRTKPPPHATRVARRTECAPKNSPSCPPPIWPT